jgi:hypothetical protein
MCDLCCITSPVERPQKTSYLQLWDFARHYTGLQVRLKVMFGDQWSVVRKVLTTDIETALDSYWARVRQEEKEEGVFITPAAEVRELQTPLHYQNPANASIGCHHSSER